MAAPSKASPQATPRIGRDAAPPPPAEQQTSAIGDPLRPAPAPLGGVAAESGAAQASSTREAVLSLLLRLGEATAADLSQRLSVSVQVMRRHLKGLGEDGLVESSPTAEGPGRPSNRWRLSAAGQSRFPDGSEQFALSLLQSLAGTMPPEALSRLLEGQAMQKARDYRARIGGGSLAERLERLVELRRQEGYVAECRPDPEQAGAWLISEFHCSVMKIAEAFPQVCDQELQLILHTFPDCRIERVHWRLEEGHSCGFRLTPVSPAREP